MSDFEASSALQRVIETWQTDSFDKELFVNWSFSPQEKPSWADFPASLNPKLLRALKMQGIENLYSHQAESIQNLLAGKNLVITTGTSSGKSLCYQIPILHKYLEDPNSTALFIFPTKALTQDQRNTLSHLLHSIEDEPQIDELACAIYDGDTPSNLRQLVRKQSRLIFTNPDMLHLGILPHHTNWQRFLASLKYIVIDEIHTYRGVFGAHVINLIRRLKRILAFYGSYPQFILTSATIANAKEHAQALIEEDVHWVSQNGAPRGEKHFAIVNPPIVHPELGIRQSPLVCSLRLLTDLTYRNIHSIVFMRTRRMVELLYRQMKDQMPSARIDAYRSGYLPTERRRIETDLKSGETQAVIATNALELGIDIGGIDAALMVGYPGTIAAVAQQAGRAGRREKPSLAALIASQTPLDQYLVKHPDFLLNNSPESIYCNPDNVLILLSHLKCASFELPFRGPIRFGNADAALVQGLLMFLTEENQLVQRGNDYYWSRDSYPSTEIGLRTFSGNTIELSATLEGKSVKIGSVDLQSAYWMVHPDAVYLHQGDSYLVRELDLELGHARLEKADVEYYTEPRSETEVDGISIVKSSQLQFRHDFYGEVNVRTQVVGYKKVRWNSQEILAVESLEMPSTTLETMGFWLTITPDAVEQLQKMAAWTNSPNDYGPEWSEIRNFVLARDQYRCMLCGVSIQPSLLHVHHKIPFKAFEERNQANAPGNLVTLCPACHRRSEMIVKMKSSLSGLCYVLQNLAPLFVMCDPMDLGSLADSAAAFSEKAPTVLLYDQVPGGIGLCENVFSQRAQLLDSCLDVIRDCDCEDGCPGCVGPGGENGIGGKLETYELLKLITTNHG